MNKKKLRKKWRTQAKLLAGLQARADTLAEKSARFFQRASRLADELANFRRESGLIGD